MSGIKLSFVGCSWLAMLPRGQKMWVGLNGFGGHENGRGLCVDVPITHLDNFYWKTGS